LGPSFLRQRDDGATNLEMIETSCNIHINSARACFDVISGELQMEEALIINLDSISIDEN
jgi:hypothetical protein